MLGEAVLHCLAAGPPFQEVAVLPTGIALQDSVFFLFLIISRHEQMAFMWICGGILLRLSAVLLAAGDPINQPALPCPCCVLWGEGTPSQQGWAQKA